MLNKGRMLVAGIICMLLLAGCGKDEALWGDRPSYIVTTDTISVIYVLDDTGAVLASITPLQDSMQGIWSPTLIEGSKKLAFLSRERPSYPPQLYITDRSGKDLTPYGVASPSWLDGSPTAPELIFTVSERISILDVDKQKISSLFSDTSAESEAVGHISFTKAMAPAFSPDGEAIAFINQGIFKEEDPWGQLIDKPRADLGLVQRDGSKYRLLTGAIVDPLPSTGNWLAICWSHDGRWIFAVRESDGMIGTIYAIRCDETRPDVLIVPVQKDWFKSYAYITASPTDDTLLLGTAPRHADLYVWEFREEAGIIIPGSVVSGRLTTSEIFADPDWGPGAE